MSGEHTASNAAPQNPSIFIKATPELRERVRKAAARERRSVSNFIATVLERHLDTLESECRDTTSDARSAVSALSSSESPES